MPCGKRFPAGTTVIKKLLGVMLFCSVSYGLNAPYLISATALSDSSVSLSWRNNDIATTGFILQRKDSTETAYHFIDSVKSASQLTYTDLKGLLPATLYTYQVIAYNSMEVSDTSNSVQVITLRVAPYLISVTAYGDSSVSLIWRNKGKATQGFIIQRTDSTETVFHSVDSVKSATQLTYTDTQNLRPGTLYTYQVISYDAMDVQDTSNSRQVTIRPDIFTKPSLSVNWNFETSTFVLLTIQDNTNCEIGYKIYRDEGLSSVFSLVATIISANPDTAGAITWYDNSISLNQWYGYKVAVYKSDSSIFSDSNSTFTLHSSVNSNVIRFQKLSDFPVSPGGISAIAGDSIILKENPSPAGQYTAINVTDPVNPKFDGYVDSSVLLSYPQQTLIPAYLNFGVSNGNVIHYMDRMLIAHGDSITMFQIVGSNLVFIDDFILSGMSLGRMLLLNDSILAVIADTSFSGSGYYGLSTNYPYSVSVSKSYLYPVKLISSGFISVISRVFIAKGYYHYNGRTPLHHVLIDTVGTSYIHGCYNGTTLISNKKRNSYADVYPFPYIQTYDSSASIGVVNGDQRRTFTWGNTADGGFEAYNTGSYISPTENLCTAGSALFVADIRDLPDGYNTALANNAVYRDSAGLTPQNILLDTIKKRVYLFFSNKLSILTYQYATPNTPALVSPVNGATDQPVLLTFIWNKDTLAAGYHVQVATDSVFSSLFADDSTLTDTLVPIGGLDSSGTYYWRVRATNAGGISAWSEVRSFMTVTSGVRPYQPPLPTVFSVRFYAHQLRYTLPQACRVSVRYFNLKGRQVASLVNRVQGPGYYTLQVDRMLLSSGVYCMVFEAGSFVKKELTAVVR